MCALNPDTGLIWQTALFFPFVRFMTATKVFTVPQNVYLLCLELLHGHTEGDMPQHEPLGDHFLPYSEFSLACGERWKCQRLMHFMRLYLHLHLLICSSHCERVIMSGVCFALPLATEGLSIARSTSGLRWGHGLISLATQKKLAESKTCSSHCSCFWGSLQITT